MVKLGLPRYNKTIRLGFPKKYRRAVARVSDTSAGIYGFRE